MPRPRRYKAIRITSFYVPIEKARILEMSQELAQREGITLSELILNALGEYIERHYPSNPQISLETAQNPLTEPLTLKARFIAEDIENLLKWNIKDAHWHNKIRRKIIALAELNKRLKQKKYEQLIKLAMKEMKNKREIKRKGTTRL